MFFFWKVVLTILCSLHFHTDWINLSISLKKKKRSLLRFWLGFSWIYRLRLKSLPIYNIGGILHLVNCSLISFIRVITLWRFPHIDLVYILLDLLSIFERYQYEKRCDIMTSIYHEECWILLNTFPCLLIQLCDFPL